MATSQAQVGLPVRYSGVARLVVGILIGVVAAALVAALMGLGAGVEAVPYRGVDAYSLKKVFEVKDLDPVAAKIAAIPPGESFDYTGFKLEQVRGQAPLAVPIPPNLPE